VEVNVRFPSVIYDEVVYPRARRERRSAAAHVRETYLASLDRKPWLATPTTSTCIRVHGRSLQARRSFARISNAQTVGL